MCLSNTIIRKIMYRCRHEDRYLLLTLSLSLISPARNCIRTRIKKNICSLVAKKEKIKGREKSNKKFKQAIGINWSENVVLKYSVNAMS